MFLNGLPRLAIIRMAVSLEDMQVRDGKIFSSGITPDFVYNAT
jgi:hypothetical protein